MFVPLPIIDIEVATSHAIDNKFLIPRDKDILPTGILPGSWIFGPDVSNLQTMILEAIKVQNSQQQDFHEEILTQWLFGHYQADVLVAVRHLLDLKLIAEYHLIDNDEDGNQNDYLFYSLYANRHKRWGMKQFKDVSKLTIGEGN